MVRKLLSTLLVVGLTQAGCYNTYNVSLDEMAKAQEGGASATVEITPEVGEPIIISENTKLGVTTTDGEYYAVSPFNFTLTRAQLVAPDEDLLLGRSEIETGNVRQISGSKTTMLVVGGVVALVGAALVIALTADERKEFGE
jgi:archaellin